MLWFTDMLPFAESKELGFFSTDEIMENELRKYAHSA